MRILFLLLFPVFLSAQINNAYGVIEIGSFPTSSSTGPKFAYRPADSSFYRWVSGSTWVKIIPDEPDTLYLKQLSGTTALVDGDTIDISTYFLKSDTTSAFASYLKRPVGWGLSLLTGKYPFVDSSKVASRYYVSTSPTTIANNYIATSNGTNLVARNLFDNNTYVGILNSKPFSLGQWTTAGRPTGTNGYAGFNTSFNWPEWYSSSSWFSPLQSSLTGGIGAATRIFYGDANGRATATDLLTITTIPAVSTLQVLTTGAARARLRLQSTTNTAADLIFHTAGGGLSSVTASSSLFYFESLQNLGFSTSAINGKTSFLFSGVEKVVFRGDNVGIKDLTPSYSLDILATDAIAFPGGTVAQRPATEASKYLLRYNTDSSAVEIGTHTSTWNFLSTRAYTRGMTLGNQLQAGNVHITPTAQRSLTFKRTQLSVSTDVYDSTGVGKIIIQPDTTIQLNIFSIRNAEMGQSLLQFGGGRSIGFRGLNYTGRKQFWDIERVNLINSTILPLYGEQGAAQSFSIGASKIDFIGDLANSSLSRIRFQTGNQGVNTYSQPLTLYENGTAVVGWGNPAYYGRKPSSTITNFLPPNFPDQALVVGDTCTNCNDLSKVTFVHDPNDSTFIKGNIRFFSYGTPSTTAAALSKTESGYVAGFATDGTVTSREIKRDTTIYVVDADYDFSAAITTAQIAARHNRVIFWMTTTAAAGTDSELTLHTPDINLMQVEYLIHSVDEAGGFDNRIIFGTNNAVDSTNGLVTNYYPAAGDGVHIRAGLRSGVYKYRYSN